jgi:hypothetical protein
VINVLLRWYPRCREGLELVQGTRKIPANYSLAMYISAVGVPLTAALCFWPFSPRPVPLAVAL